jgi:prefoldin subunit 5
MHPAPSPRRPVGDEHAVEREREQMIEALERLKTEISATRDALDAQIELRRPSATD